MVHCIVVGCGSKSGKHKGKFHCIPKIVSNQGEEHKELTRKRRTRWISAVSRGDTKEKRVLESERVRSLHSVSGKAAAVWDKYNVDWVPTVNLGKPRDLQSSNEKDLQREAVECRAKRAKDRRKRSLERQEMEAAKKRKELDKSGSIVQKIDFCIDYSSTGKLLCSEPSCSKDFYDGECETVGETTLHMVENSTSTEDFLIVCEGSSNTDTQIDEFNYMFTSSVYRAPDERFFDSSDKIRFYTGLPSYEVLMVVFEHVAPNVARKHSSTILGGFQEFVMVLMKLRLDMPFQDLAYRFVVSLSSVSRIFTSWIVAMDSRLSCFIYWPKRD
ncbi:uncharacterized protein LOC111337765 [Stylophora pistillata]|uniref:uncharacterized protein LOC111337765 n=1 Tax=Stylophora pistillata TaxID=50429 RepID=UPI000C0476D8|nr:uncharacterized protein LOC111337765 [Stylophora pistillata]